MLPLEKNILHKILTVLLYCRFVAFIFVLCSLLSVIRKQWLEQYNYSDIQSVLMTGFWTDFMSSVWDLCC